jgi:hypothetical protein
MRKRIISKTVALFLCLSFVALTVPGLNSAEKRSHGVDFRLLLKKPMAMLSSISSFFTSIFDNKAPDYDQDSTSSTEKGKMKTLGGSAAVKVSK